jgi:phage shock protein A
VAEEEMQEPTGELVLTDPTDDDVPSADPDDEWNPSESLDLTYNNLIEALRMVRRSVSDTASTREVVEFQIQQLEERVEVPAGSLGSIRAAIDEQIVDLRTQRNQIGTRFENLLSISAQFQRDVERFRTEKELLKASYAAVEALTMMGDAVTSAPPPGSSLRTA